MHDLRDFVNGLVPVQEKVASDLELEAFDHLLAQSDEEEKVAYAMMGGGSDDWLSRFQHTPLYEKAIALKEKDLALEKRRMEERQRREKAYRHDDSTWNEQDKLCLEKDKLTLELHKLRASQEAKAKLKTAAVLKVAGNGDPLREKMRRLGQIKKAGSYETKAREENKRVEKRRKGEDARRASPTGRGIAGGVLGGVVGHYLGDTVTRGTAHNQKGRVIGAALGVGTGGYSGYRMGKAVRDLQDRKRRRRRLVEYRVT